MHTYKHTNMPIEEITQTGKSSIPPRAEGDTMGDGILPRKGESPPNGGGALRDADVGPLPLPPKRAAAAAARVAAVEVGAAVDVGAAVEVGAAVDVGATVDVGAACEVRPAATAVVDVDSLAVPDSAAMPDEVNFGDGEVATEEATEEALLAGVVEGAVMVLPLLLL